jgi:hypothetical protein
MLSTCTEPGCKTLVFGSGACLVHEPRQSREFVRGRPFARPPMANGTSLAPGATSARTRFLDQSQAIALTRS